jgi:hypothetical protein
VQHAVGKILTRATNFGLDLISIKGLHTKLWGSKVAGIPALATLGLPFGSHGTKSHLDMGLVERHRVYYKGEGGGFPQVRGVVNLVSLSCPWFVLTSKVFQLCTNHFVLVLCRSVWVVEACQFFLVPSRSSSTPLYPSKVLRTRERAPTFDYFVVFTLDSLLSLSRSLGVRHFPYISCWVYFIKHSKVSHKIVLLKEIYYKYCSNKIIYLMNLNAIS